MVVWLTAFALSQENYAIRFGMPAQTLLPTRDLPWLREQCHSWMEKGRARWHFCDRKAAGRMAAHLKSVCAVDMRGPLVPQPQAHQSQAACSLGSFSSRCLSCQQKHFSLLLHLILAFGLPTLLPIWILQWPFLGYLKGHAGTKPPNPLAETLNSDSSQNYTEILSKQVFSNQILTGSVTGSLQLER